MSTLSTSTSWRSSPEELVLDDNEVHVWRASLHQKRQIVRALSEHLKPDERKRAHGFRFPLDREYFVVGRGVLRDILSRYLRTTPDQISFSYNDYGKPTLDGEGGDQGLRFNLSHSHGVALYVVTRERSVGVDLEFIREDFDCVEIATRFFSPSEVTTVRTLLPNLQAAAFFNCWTRKEAFIKAIGDGLSRPLDQFSVSLVPKEPACLLSIDDDSQAAARWYMKEIFPGPGFTAAVVTEGHPRIFHYWQWYKRTSQVGAI